MRHSNLGRLLRRTFLGLIPIALIWAFVANGGTPGTAEAGQQLSIPISDGAAGSPPRVDQAQQPPAPFTPGVLLVSFQPNVSDSTILSITAGNGTQVARIHTFVNEDLNGDGFLNPGEDENGNGVLDKLQIYLLKITAPGLSESQAVADFSGDPRVDFAVVDVIGRERDHLSEPDDPLLVARQQWGLNNRGQAIPPPGGPVGRIDADIDAPQAWEHSIGSRTIDVAVFDGGIAVGHPDLYNEDANGNGVLDPGEDGNANGILDSDNIFTNGPEIGAPLGNADIDNPPLGNFPGAEDIDVNGNGILDPDDDPCGVADDFRGANFLVVPPSGALPASNHGTHVAGIIGAIGNNALGVSGVNWQVSLLPVATDSNLNATLAAAAYVMCLNGSGDNVRVVNYSQGSSPADFAAGDSMAAIYPQLVAWQTALTPVMAALNAAGILWVQAAGYDRVNVDTTRPEDRNGNGVLDPADVNVPPLGDFPGPGDVDNNGNGVFDGGEDVNGNGMLDPIGADINGDGAGDRFLDLPCVLPDANIICVTSSNNTDSPSLFGPRNAGQAGTGPSNFGTISVDLFAPGSQVLSTVIQGTGLGGGDYDFLSGTSMAAPHVAGAAAHCMSLFPAETHLQIKARLLNGVDSRPSLNAAWPAGGPTRVVSGIGNDGRLRMCMGDDFGDAPDPFTGPGAYPTLKRNPALGAGPQVGASHEDIGEEWFGTGPPFRAIRNNGDGQPRLHSREVSPEFDANVAVPLDADGPMNLIDNDFHDDGIVIVPPAGGAGVVNFQVCTENHQVVDADGGRYIGGAGPALGVPARVLVNRRAIFVNGFFDWNLDGDFDDMVGGVSEYAFSRQFLPPAPTVGAAGAATCHGFLAQPYAAPAVVPDVIRARFRLDYGEDAQHGLAGLAPGVEVDHVPAGPPAARYDASATLNRSRGQAQFGEVQDYPPAPVGGIAEPLRRTDAPAEAAGGSEAAFPDAAPVAAAVAAAVVALGAGGWYARRRTLR